MFKVKYYQHTGHFYENIQPHSNEIHITQSASLSEYLRKKAVNSNVFGYMSFLESIFTNWYHPHTEVYLKSAIRKYIIEHVDESQRLYYNKSLEDYYLSFRFLVEYGGLKLQHFPELNTKQRLLVPMVQELYQDAVVREYLDTRASLNKARILGKLRINHDVETIYFHHFDYVDARRMMLFQWLKQIGFEVVFCIPYNPKYPDLYQSWDIIYKYISDEIGNQWECVDSSSIQQGSKFAYYLDKNYIQKEDDREDISFITFNHPTEFKDYLDVNPLKKDHHEVAAVFEANLNIYMNQVPHHHFYATSYGKFFLSLQNCKKTNDDIKLDYDDYVNMMISGWVQVGNINGSQALTLLIDLRDYMDGVSNFKEILKRLQALVYLQEFGNAFDDLAKEQTERNKLKKYLSNPFRALPYVNMSRYNMTVKQLIECTKDLMRKVNLLLLPDHSTRNVSEYLNDIHKIYMNVKDNWDPSVTKKFDVLFHVEIPKDWEFSKEEIFQLLTLYLASEDKNDEEKIGNFDELVGKTLTSQHIHVTDLSFETFPWMNPPLPSLLTHSWLKKCIVKSFISNNKKVRLKALLVDYYSRELTRQRSLYFLYHLIAFAKGKITLSYIKDLHENDGPSVYFTILEELYKQEESSFILPEKAYEWEDDFEYTPVEVSKEKMEMIPDLLWLDSDFCHKKFFLNAFVEQHPIYEKDFHQEIVFATIGKLFSEQGEGEIEVQRVMFPLFPQWTNAHKQNLIDISSARGIRSYKSFENIYYPRAMKRMQVLYSRYEVTKNWKAKYQYDHDTFKINEHIKEFEDHIFGTDIQAKSGHHCRMCPFLHVCEEGEYVIDANDD